MSEVGGTRQLTRHSSFRTHIPGRLMFQVKPHSDRLPAKDRVLGVWTDDGARAYPVAAFDSDHRVVEEVLGGRRFTVEFDGSANSLRVANADPVVQWMYSLWFAWYAMRPETSVFER